MTCREKLKLEHPECSESIELGGCTGCPSDYGYLSDPRVAPDTCCSISCTECWDRVIPGEKVEKVEALKYEPYEPASIKDSGDRTEFATGAVRDMHEGKGRMDLLPWAAIMEVSKHCENGAKKYGEHNVDKGIPTHSLCDSAARHLAKYLDDWDDEPHLVAAAWNLLWAIQMTIKNTKVVDTPWRLEDMQDTSKG